MCLSLRPIIITVYLLIIKRFHPERICISVAEWMFRYATNWALYVYIYINIDMSYIALLLDKQTRRPMALKWPYLSLYIYIYILDGVYRNYLYMFDNKRSSVRVCGRRVCLSNWALQYSVHVHVHAYIFIQSHTAVDI